MIELLKDLRAEFPERSELIPALLANLLAHRERGYRFRKGGKLKNVEESPQWADLGYEVGFTFIDESRVEFAYSDHFVALAFPGSSAPHVWLSLSGADEAAVESEFARIAASLTEKVPNDSGKIPVRFWTMGQHGPSSRTRDLLVPQWGEIGGNYALKTSEAVQRIMQTDSATVSGRLILWHGLPGTGKSYAIRALLREWKDWCVGHYVIDPEVFFGSGAYMSNVITSMEEPEWEEDPETGGSLSKGRNKSKWMLLIIEDADEFLTTDAKDRAGQSVARLLNLADGFIGQGLNVLVLITTNEQIDRIHPAMRRPGRCLANIEFDKLNPSEVDAWLSARGADADSKAHTLAELYELLGTGQIESRPVRRGVGFGLK